MGWVAEHGRVALADTGCNPPVDRASTVVAIEAAGDILKAMPNHHLGLYLLIIAGLCCIWFGVWVVKLFWRELSGYMHTQRSGG